MSTTYFELILNLFGTYFDSALSLSEPFLRDRRTGRATGYRSFWIHGAQCPAPHSSLPKSSLSCWPEGHQVPEPLPSPSRWSEHKKKNVLFTLLEEGLLVVGRQSLVGIAQLQDHLCFSKKLFNFIQFHSILFNFIPCFYVFPWSLERAKLSGRGASSSVGAFSQAKDKRSWHWKLHTRHDNCTSASSSVRRPWCLQR